MAPWLNALFQDGPEYEERLKTPFAPPTVTVKELHEAVPKHLLQKNSKRASLYVARDIFFAVFLYKFAFSITPWSESNFGGFVAVGWHKNTLSSILWISYWWFQSLVGAGMFCLGHDAGHGSLYHDARVNNAVGFLFHSYLLIPYFSWRATHHNHHKATGSIERDENYVPYTRKSFNLPDEKTATRIDYDEVFEETPIYTLYRMLIMQIFGWWVYLSFNIRGLPSYPPGTNHFNPNSALFKEHQRSDIVMSNIGLMCALYVLYLLGLEFFLWCWLIPYILVNHWIVMITFLQHSDPTVPHYRKGEWTFLRGAAATIDRPLLGWIGRFFLHNVSHDHIAHHFFLKAPFYNGPEITKAIKTVLKEDYNYDSTPTFYALYRSFTQCLFVEDEGDIVFYKNKDGLAQRQLRGII